MADANPNVNRGFINMVSMKFGSLTVIELAGNKNKSYTWRCTCDCGGSVVVAGWNLRSGHTKSCGCLARKINAIRCTKHGMCGQTEYTTWCGMLNRCSQYGKNKRNKRNYFDRGIRVCERWLQSFENFFADMGPKPSPLHSIDRIDNNGNYEPGNCRWATYVEQNANTRSNVVIECDGKTMIATDWAKATGVDAQRIWRRIRMGWPPHLAIRNVSHSESNMITRGLKNKSPVG